MEITTTRELLLEILSDFRKYSETFLKIQTIESELVPLELNEVQRLICDIFDDIKSRGRRIRVYILKARRQGISTLIAARFFYKTATSKNKYAMMITHEPDATDFLFHIHKRFHNNLPEYIKPADRYNNKKMLEFNTEDGKGLDSAIRVGTAGKEDFASSQLIHYCHFSEMAKYPPNVVKGLLASVLQCVPDHYDTEVIFESTAKGVGGAFYDGFWSSRYFYEIYLKDGVPTFKQYINEKASPSNEYTSIFVPFFVFSKYKMAVKEPLKLTDEEKLLVETYGLTDEHIAWRRWAIENKCGGDINIFNQEYPHNAISAFISKSDNIFPIEKLMRRISSAPQPVAKYEVSPESGNWYVRPEGRFWVWQEPKETSKYIVSADVAEGLSEGDFSSIDVIEMQTGYQVAHWHGKISPDALAKTLFWIGRRYMNALLVVERNQHGLLVLDRLSTMGYTNLYCETVVIPPASSRKRYGWVTTKTSKPLIIDNLCAEIRSDEDGINCVETLKEMLEFKQHEDGGMGAEVGKHDDRVISIAIAKYVRTKMPFWKQKEMAKIAFRTRPAVRPVEVGVEAWT